MIILQTKTQQDTFGSQAMKVLQTYRLVSTGLFSKITCSHKYCQIQYAHACFYFLMQNTLAFEHKDNEIDNTFGYKC